MKQLIGSDIGSYVFNATARTITFSGVTLTLEQLLLITDVTAGVTVYQFNSSSLGGSLASNVLTLDFNTSALSNSDTLQIYVDLPSTQPVSIAAPVAVTGTFFQATQPVSGTVAVSNLPGTQPVSGSVSVSNLPGTQPVSGSVSVTNFPTSTTVTGTVAVTGTFYQATQPVSGTISVSNFPSFPASQPVTNAGTFAVQDTVLSGIVSGGRVPVTDSAAETSLAALAATVSTLGSPAAIQGINTATVPTNVFTVEINGGLAANATFTGAWHDSFAEETNFVAVTTTESIGSVSMHLDQSDDQTNISSNAAVSYVPTVATPFTMAAGIQCRYWRVRFINSTSPQAPLTITSVSRNLSNTDTIVGALGSPLAQNPSGRLVATLPDGNSATDGNVAASYMQAASSGSASTICVTPMLMQGGALTVNNVLQRTPSAWRGGEGGSTAGAFPVFVPAIPTKKVRLMKYKIEIAEDATLTSGGVIRLSLAYGLPTSVAATILTPPQFVYQHRVFIPSAVGSPPTEGFLYDSDVIDLQNGYLSPLAGQTLYCGLQVPQTTAAVTPSFTLPNATQWEAGIFAFKTAGNLGNFKLFQASPSAAGTNTVSIVPQSTGTQQGNLAIAIVRTSNISAGVPTVGVADTLGNVYTPLAQITNASDTGGGFGCSLQFFYCLNCLGGTNTITATGTVHVPSAIQMCYLEYQNISAVGSASQVSATGGSNVTPAPGSFTPGEAGDLIIMYAAASTASQATLGTVSSPFFMRARAGGATGPTMFVADNWGNGALTTGAVNVVAIGTEE